MQEKFTGGGFGSKIYSLTNNSTIQFLLKAIYPPPPYINCISLDVRKEIRSLIFKKGNTILDIGSGISKGPGSWLWDHVDNEIVTVTRMDIVDGPNVDIVGDATDPPDDLGTFDAIILQAVPEHIRNIELLFIQVKKHLNKDGIVYIEMPFLQGVHADPDDYWRATPAGIQALTEPLIPLQYGVSGGPFGALIWIFSDLFSSLTSSTIINSFIRFTTRWIFAPLRYADIILRETPAAKRLASEYYYLAKKNDGQ